MMIGRELSTYRLTAEKHDGYHTSSSPAEGISGELPSDERLVAGFKQKPTSSSRRRRQRRADTRGKAPAARAREKRSIRRPLLELSPLAPRE